MQLYVSGTAAPAIWQPWRLESDEYLGPATKLDVGPDRGPELLRLASDAEIAQGTSAYWACDFLDGAVLSITHYDGQELGRVHFVNSRSPGKEFKELFDAIDLLVDPYRPDWRRRFRATEGGLSQSASTVGR